MILAQSVSTWLAAIPVMALLLGGGLLALDERMRRKFAPREGLYDQNGRALYATKEDLNGLGEKVTATLSLLQSQRDQWDAVERAVDRLTLTQETQRGHVSEHLTATAKTLERVAGKLQEVSDAQIEQGALLRQLLKEAGK